MSAGHFVVHDGNGTNILELKGREEWALSHLLAAGEQGCTPIDTPGPRSSDYVFKFRRRGIDIATITELHGGPYAGHHTRYILRSKVERLSPLPVLQLTWRFQTSSEPKTRLSNRRRTIPANLKVAHRHLLVMLCGDVAGLSPMHCGAPACRAISSNGEQEKRTSGRQSRARVLSWGS